VGVARTVTERTYRDGMSVGFTTRCYDIDGKLVSTGAGGGHLHIRPPITATTRPQPLSALRVLFRLWLSRRKSVRLSVRRPQSATARIDSRRGARPPRCPDQ
jgi:hypothetical protein